MMLRHIRFAVAAGMAAAVGCAQTPPPKPDIGPPTVTVSRPLLEKVTEYTDLTGYTDAVATVEVRPRVSGFILKVSFKDGQEVKQNDLLFEIDPAPYKADLKRAEGELKTWQAQFKYTEADVARNFKGLSSGAVSREDYEKSIASKAIAEANIGSAQGAIDRAKLNLGWCQVVAPIAGKVDRAYLTEGNVVTGGLSQGTVLTTIVSMDPMYAYFDVDDATVLFYQKQVREGRLKAASPGSIVVEMRLKDEQGYPHAGRVDFISNRINPATGSLQVRGQFDNQDRKLYPGLFARARIPVSEPVEALLVPDSAVLSELARRTVFVVNDQNVVEARPVKVGPLFRGLRIIAEGLSPRDRVIIVGAQRVRPKVTVQVEEGKITQPKELAGVDEKPAGNGTPAKEGAPRKGG